MKSFKLPGFVNIILVVLITIGIFYGFIWMGIKGIIGFVLGMTVMSYLILSKNPVLLFAIKMTTSEDYIKNIMEDDKND